MSQPRVVAVVVTFNRLDLLSRLIARLREIDTLAAIVVVDNASSDGTAEYLAAESGDSLLAGSALVVERLPDNRGGAGGFHAGLARAMELGADLTWLMDDDGLPDPDCLDRLLARRDEFDFWGPVVVDEADQSRLVFPIRLPGGTTVVRALDDVRAAASDGVIRDVVIPFNGVLVTRGLVERIGLVREEFFIWGDDHEYRLRAERAGARIGTVTDARVLHPSVGELGTPMMLSRTTYNHSPSDLKHYCMARNNLLNLRDYKGWPHALAFVLKTIWFYTFTRRDPARLRLSFSAMRAGLRGDFTGHRAFLGPAASTRAGTSETVAVVVVTYNRADLLAVMLDGLAAQTRPPDAVFVIDNASHDHTQEVLRRDDLPLHVTRLDDNTGGAGGFHEGLRQAHAAGYDRLWLMDDDVLPDERCLEELMAYDEDCLMAVREDRHGALVEKSATDFDLANPLSIRPKRASVETTYADRAAMPPLVELQVVAFEGFLVRRRVIDTIGFPDPTFFIFYDDAEFAIRARAAGFRIWAVRDAILTRQLDFDQQHALESWKGRYMYRNLFVVHFRHGRNALVRAKPYAIAAVVSLLSPLRGGRAERGNVQQALKEARGMRVAGSETGPPTD